MRLDLSLQLTSTEFDEQIHISLCALIFIQDQSVAISVSPTAMIEAPPQQSASGGR